MRRVTEYRRTFLELTLGRPLHRAEVDALDQERCLGCGAVRGERVTKPHRACGWRTEPPLTVLPPLTLD